MDSPKKKLTASKDKTEISRRRFLQVTATAALVPSATQAQERRHPDSRSRDNPIVRENAKPGALDWQLTRVRLDKQGGFRSPLIEGYCSRQSLKAGETLDIFVSTKPAARFHIEIFRTGYYGGRGARFMTKLGPFDGKEQPVPTPGEKRLHECRWEACASLKIPADWVSGVYLGRLTTSPAEGQPYWQSYVVFIVKDDRPADILFQCSDNTWQAYNRWPNDFSIYTDPRGNQGPWSDVSFDRPYAKYAQIYENPQSVGSGEWLCFEFPMAYWLEQQGYDVTYCSNSDLHTPDRGLKCKAFLSVGHDEYWDIRAYDSVVALRDAGVNVLFFSGNSVCWVTPMRAGFDGRENRIMFRGGPYGGDYRYAVNREKNHGPFPERGPDEGFLIGARNVEPSSRSAGSSRVCAISRRRSAKRSRMWTRSSRKTGTNRPPPLSRKHAGLWMPTSERRAPARRAPTNHITGPIRPRDSEQSPESASSFSPLYQASSPRCWAGGICAGCAAARRRVQGSSPRCARRFSGRCWRRISSSASSSSFR